MKKTEFPLRMYVLVGAFSGMMLFLIATLLHVYFLESDLMRPAALISHIATGLLLGSVTGSMIFFSFKLRSQNKSLLARRKAELERQVERKTAELLSINENLQKEIDERRKAEQIAENQASKLEILQDSLLYFVSLPNNDDVFQALADKIHQFSGSSVVIVTEYSEINRALVCRAFVGLDVESEQLKEILGFSLLGQHFPFEDHSTLELFLSGRLHKIKGDIEEISFGMISPEVSSLAMQEFGFGDIYGMGFVRNDKIFGGAIIINRGKDELDIELLEAFGNEASIILQRKEAEEAVKESEEKFRMLATHSQLGIAIFQASNTVYANEAFIRIWGFEDDDLSKMDKNGILALVHPDDREFVGSQYEKKQIGSGDHIPNYSMRVVHGDGSICHLDLYSRPVLVKGAYANFVTVIDSTERKQVEDALAESESRHRLLVENAPIGIIATDTGGNIQEANPRLVEILGSPSIERTQSINLFTTKGLIDAGISERFKSCAKTGEPSIGLSEYVSIWGKITNLRHHLRAIKNNENEIVGVQGIVEDISDQIRAEKAKEAMEADLRHQQKLEAMGTLAAGVAHEINNPINIIMNYGELIRDEMGDNPEVDKFAQNIIAESNRVAVIVRNLLSFARADNSLTGPVELNELVDTTLSLMRNFLSKDRISVNVEIDKDLPRLQCNPQQLQQVFMNLITNARDALNERYPNYHEDKKINIVTSKIEKNGQKCVRCTVEDFGSGISEDIIDRIFDPFYTTKPRDVGTGLGLSVSHGIVKDHGGNLWVESREKEFTRFHIDLCADSAS